jgi:integral membrane protein
MNLLQRYEAAQPFTEGEAWLLFRIAAISEACGWTLLIAGILIERYITPGNDTAVLIAGNIHGTIYLAYFAAALVLYPSLGWSRWRGLAALVCGVPPYGSLLFEQWAAHKRRNNGFKTYRHYLLYNVLVDA